MKTQRFGSGRVLTLVLAVALGGVATASARDGTTHTSVATQAEPDLPAVAERVVASVVNISSTRVTRARGMPADPFHDPLFERFFGPGMRQRPMERRAESLGSGVIVGADGTILTNAHVVEDASGIKVTLSDGREIEAKVVGADPKSDLAVIRLQERVDGLQPIELGDSDALRLAETVLAVGNPFGLGHTVTRGIVSAKGRARVGIVDYEDFIQTDAAINPGNSGGALVDLRGRLVGINTAIVSRSGGSQGVGFAIPVNMAVPIMKSLLEDGKVTRGWLGVAIQDLNRDLAEAFGLRDTDGVLISDVLPEGPAARGGLQRGDVVLTVNGTAVDSSSRLRNLVAAQRPGSKATLGIIRDGQQRTVEIELGALPEQVTRNGGSGGAQPGEVYGGLSLRELDATARQRFDVPDDVRGGVLVTGVEPDSEAARAGIRPGDVVVEVDRRPVDSRAAFARAYERAGHKVVLLVQRGDHALYAVLEKPRS